MRSWTGTIIGPHNSVHDGRIYQLRLFCDKDYPEKPPTVGFCSRVNMTCVNQETGRVDPKHFSMLANWRREYTMEDILTHLKREMLASKSEVGTTSGRHILLGSCLIFLFLFVT